MNMEWISVKDNPPVKDGTEFVGYENGRIFIFNFRFGDWHECAQGEIGYEVEPTHWMPLPPPPKE
jgi:hypothetical protein